MPEPLPITRAAPSFQSLQSIGGFSVVICVLMAIALPGMKGAPSSGLAMAMGFCLLYAVSGIVLGALGRAACLRSTPGWVSLLRVVAGLSLLHFPFGTYAGLRAFWLLRRPADPKA